MTNKETNMPISQSQKFTCALTGLLEFVTETNADLDMAYDFIAEQVGAFAQDNKAFDMFYDCYNEIQESMDGCLFGDYSELLGD
tara:strand:- start:1183 stop:1434 length:252 start_codon:yes stop_codon:yes gene_type:complete